MAERRRDRHTVLTFEILCEQRIVEALGRGDFEDLPGAGQPLSLEEDPLIPDDQRLAHRILKNAGFTPPEVSTRREIAELRAQLELLGDEARSRTVQRLALLMTRLSLQRGTAVNLALEQEYWERLKEKVAADEGANQ